MRKAVYPGSFDPITLGHIDVIKRAAKLFDEVVVAVAHNDAKQPLFTIAERVELISACLEESRLTNVRVDAFDGLLVDYASQQQASALVRGLRAISDFEFEFQMALMNRKIQPDLETIFLMPKEEYSYISSRMVKEVSRLEGDVSSFVSPNVSAALDTKFRA